MMREGCNSAKTPQAVEAEGLQPGPLADAPNTLGTPHTSRDEIAREAAERWMVRCSTRPDDLSMCKPKDDCVFGYEQGYLAALTRSRSTDQGEAQDFSRVTLESNLRAILAEYHDANLATRLKAVMSAIPRFAPTPPIPEQGVIPAHVASVIEKIADHVTTMQREGNADFHAGCEAIAKDCTPLFERLGMANEGDGWGFDRNGDDTAPYGLRP